MKKTFLYLTALILALSLTACASASFDGSRIGNENNDSNLNSDNESDNSDLNGDNENDVSDLNDDNESNDSDLGSDNEINDSDLSGDNEKDATDLNNKRDTTSLTDDNFNSLSISDDEVISAEFDADLTENEAIFLTIEVTEDTTATAHYSYTTREKEGATWGYYLSGSKDKTSFELRAGTESVYDMFWTDEPLELKQGTNIFYISGKDISCKMHFEIRKIDKTKVSYVGVYTKEDSL